MKKKRYTGLNDKRHFCGTFAPNLFLILEMMATVELSYVLVKVLEYFGIEPDAIELLTIATIALYAIGKFLEKRRIILNRQKGRCPEEGEEQVGKEAL